jgi:LuxR family maltose regulon positive regulatory protein
MPILRQSRQESTLLGWLKALPDELFQNHPVLNVNYVGTLMQNGQFDGVESACGISNSGWLPLKIFGHPVYVSEEEFQRLPSRWSPCTMPQLPWLKAMWQTP